jgi:hypothetical protein
VDRVLSVFLAWQSSVVNVISEVDHDAFGSHSERGGDELGVHGVDQVDQAVAAGFGAGLQSSFPGPEHESGEHFDGWPQHLGDGVDPALTTSGSQAVGLVGRQSQASGGEEPLQCSGEGAIDRPGRRACSSTD